MGWSKVIEQQKTAIPGLAGRGGGK